MLKRSTTISLVIVFVLALGGIIVFLWLQRSSTSFTNKEVSTEPITLILPFAVEDDDLSGILPMGETTDHPIDTNPHGHGGLDFQWDHSVSLIAAADGEITTINYVEVDYGWSVQLESGGFIINYTELETVTPGLKEGDHVSRGDLIGTPGNREFLLPEEGRHPHFQTHWEFRYPQNWRDRVCPLTYFTPDSLARIETIWDKVWYKDRELFPYICSGDYFGKIE